MAKNVDVTGKRLISVRPRDWVVWAKKIDEIGECEILSGEFQTVSRESDTLILVNQSRAGKFIALFELQTKYSAEMPLRMAAYSALAREKYNLPVFPVLINIRPTSQTILTRYESTFCGLQARQDYAVINLWEIPAQDILEQNLTALIPFTPAMKGGADESQLQSAQAKLQLDENLRETGKLSEMEFALSLFASAILGKEEAKRILRWTMLDIIIESPLYQEIMQQGLQKGTQQGMQQGKELGLQTGREEESQLLLNKLLQRKFGELDAQTEQSVRELSLEEREGLVDAIFDLNDVADLKSWLSDYDKSAN